jgi:uncharacterized protein
MVEPITINIRHLSQDVRLPQEQVQAVIDLLDAGLPVPFIARYRKEVTKNLDEETLRTIAEELRSARVLCERKQAILKTIEAAGKLTTDFDKSIREAKTVKRLEDIYLPFKPKRQNAAVAAREHGLEPFALEILEGKLPPEKVDERAAEFINEDKKVKSVADVLFGTGHIIADIFACNAELVHKVREILYQHGHLITTKIESPHDNKKKTADGGKQTADGRRQTAAEDGGGETAESSPPSDELHEPEIPQEEIEEIEEQEIPHEEGVETEDIVAEELMEEESVEIEESMETEDSSLLPSAVCRLPSPETPEDAQEVSELFQQLKEEQAEKGLPMVRSQNALKKKKRAEAKKKLDEIKQRQREHFERQFTDYFQFSTKLRGVPAHRILAFNRGERHKIIQIVIKIDEAKILESVKDICVPKEHIHADFLTGCLQDALHRNVLPMLTQEIRNDMTEYAEKSVIKNFGKNLRALLLQRPLPQKRVLVLDPGSKNDCKAVAIDEFGNLLGHETIVLVGNAERRAETAQSLAEMIRRFSLSVIAIGSGGRSRSVEEAVAHMIETHFADSDLAYIMVNKSGLIAYSTSPAAKEELPNEDPFVRAAISIGRRLQNSMNELVKVEPASLGGITFQHDIRGKYVKQMLAEVVESCVNIVGVDVNSATPVLLTYVAGLNLMTARRIYEYRREHGAFRTREDLKKVPGINETVYTHAAGFLRIPGGDNPLDSTNIHPESYELAASILEKLGFSVNDLRSGEKMKAVAEKIAAERIGELTVKLSSELNAGLSVVRGILEDFAKPGRDPRDSQPPLMFRKTVLKFEHLTPGMELTGTILSVTDFGAFADIGLHESGFIHISQMASGYIQNAHEKAAVGNVVRLWVVEADAAKKRVSLTLLPPGTERQSAGQRSSEREHDRPPREHSSRPPRPERERRESSDKPRGDRPSHSFRDSKGDKRFERKSFDRTPKTFVSAPVKKDVKPITEKMKQGKEPMRSFSDLAQLFGRNSGESGEGKKPE